MGWLRSWYSAHAWYSARVARIDPSVPNGSLGGTVRVGLLIASRSGVDGRTENSSPRGNSCCSYFFVAFSMAVQEWQRVAGGHS